MKTSQLVTFVIPPANNSVSIKLIAYTPQPIIGTNEQIGEVVQSKIYANFSLDTFSRSPRASKIGPTIKEFPLSVNHTANPPSHMPASHFDLVLTFFVTMSVKAIAPPDCVSNVTNPPIITIIKSA